MTGQKSSSDSPAIRSRERTPPARISRAGLVAVADRAQLVDCSAEPRGELAELCVGDLLLERAHSPLRVGKVVPGES